MTPTALESLVRTARDAGVLPADTAVPTATTAMTPRPWPVVLLTALGAWLAALPLLALVAMLFGRFVTQGAGSYVVGALLLIGAIVVLRSRSVPLFVEQLAVPALVAGFGTLGMGLFRDVGSSVACAWLGAVALGVAVVLRVPWLRVLLGAAATVFFGVALWSPYGHFFLRADSSLPWWVAIHALLLPWMIAIGALEVRALRGRAAAAVDSIAAGWVLALLAALAWWSGMTFLVGGAVPGFAGDIVRGLGMRGVSVAAWHGLQAASAALALVGVVVAAHRWSAMRHPALVAAGLVLAALAAVMPSLGATLLVLALLVTSGRWRRAAVAGAAAVWIVGAFYYQLAWPLATKAGALATAGALLAGLAWWAGARIPKSRSGVGAVHTNRADQVNDATRATHAAPTPWRPPGDTPARARLGVALAAAAVLAVANIGIAQKERLIRDGRPVFVDLAPADPRSLMQGDFMQLNFAIPGSPSERRSGLLRLDRPRVVAQVDARGIGRLVRIDDGTPRAADELAIELTPKDGRWTLVTDAWFFAEGEAERWQQARYGEFRVDESGRALLVGLRGANLELLK